ncbi:peptidase S8/S53 domain-containing protein [Paraphoma chrysanthemicola]|nr:peptidase S8/S53 domain-containing protein [Paraphoma chrysanthemicola]
MKLSSLLYATLLSLSPYSIYASLPYSVPDLGHHPLFDRNIDTERPSLSTHTTASASLLPFESSSSNRGSLPSSQSLAYNTSSFDSGGRISPTGHPSRDSSPFPTSSNTTTTQLGSVGSITNSKTTLQQSVPSPGVSFTNTTLTNTITLSSASSPTPSTPISNVTSTVINSERLSLNRTVIFVTVTPSIGSPILVTQTQSQLRPSTLPSSSQGRLSSASSGGGAFASLFPSRSPLPSGGGVFASMFTGQVPRSSGTPIENEEPRATFPSFFVVDAVIDDQAYHLPYPDQPPIKILLADGSLAQLFATKVLLRGQTLDIPETGTGEQTVSFGGQTIKTRPGKSKTPESDDSDGGSSGGGPFGLLGKLAGAAGSAAKGLGNAASGLVNFAAGTAGAGGDSAGQLASTLSGAMSGASTIVSSLNGIQQSFPLDEFTRNGMNTFLGAQNLGRESLDWMQSTGKMLETFDNLKPDVQQKLRNNIRDYTKPDGPLFKASDALQALSDFPWESEAPTTERPTPTATPDQTKSAQATLSTPPMSSVMSASASTTIRSTTDSSSSATPSPTNGLLPYIFITKKGTPLEKFKSFIQEIDKGSGETEIKELRQVYRTNLTTAQAEGLQQKYPILLGVYADVIDPNAPQSEEFHAIPKATKEHLLLFELAHHLDRSETHNEKSSEYSLESRAPLPGGEEAPYWKKMISSPFQDPPLAPPEKDPPYAADDSGGEGVTIYVIDDGFDLSQPALAADGRVVNTFFVNNRDAFPSTFLFTQHAMGRSEATLVTPRLGGGTGHGTKMATIAAGKGYGVAPKADLYLLKRNGEWNKGTESNKPDENYATQPPALAAVFDTIESHVRSRLRANSRAKSVINMSWGIPVQTTDVGRAMNDVLEEFLDFIEELRVPVVTAAGNSPEMRLHRTMPQKFGTADNMIITVGGVEPNGRLFKDTTPAQPGEAGSMSVYAPARDIIVPSPDDRQHSGTSQAAAIVSGLTAYLYAAPGVGSIHHPDVPLLEDNVKKFILSHAWTRVVTEDLPAGYTALDVVYNLYRGDKAHEDAPCAIQFPDVSGLEKRAGQSQSVCSRPPSSTSSATSSTATSLSRLSTSTNLVSAIPTSSSSAIIVSSLLPALTTPPASSPTPPETVPHEQCRIYVKEYDNADPNQLGEDIWNISVFPITGDQLKDNSPICAAGAEADERTGVDVQCEPLGGPLHLQREKDRTLRLRFGKETWTGSDEKCNLVKDWYVFDTTQPDDRLRETECRFECKVDWTKKPTFIIG